MISDELLHGIVDAGDMFWGDPEVQEMAQELLQRRQAEQKNLICWDLENMEEGGEDPDCLAEVTADSLRDDEERIIDVQVAVLLPNRKMRVWLTGGELREMKWEWTA